MIDTLLEDANISLFTFHASMHPTDTCGHDGLPVTPNSIKILGRFKKLQSLIHCNLCQYIDIKRGKYERLIVAAEHYDLSLFSCINKGHYRDIFDIKDIACDILAGLFYLHYNNITHRFLSTQNIMITNRNTAKLSRYGLYFLTNSNDDVSFPIIDILYAAPEVVANGPNYNVNYGPSKQSCDVWSFAMVLLDCFLEGKLWGSCRSNLSEVLKILLNIAEVADRDVNCLEELIKLSNCADRYKDMTTSFHTLLKYSLHSDPNKRPTVKQLIQHDFFKGDPQQKILSIIYNQKNINFPAVYRSENLTLPDFNNLLMNLKSDIDEDYHLSQRPICEVFHFWELAGGDVFAELKRHGFLKAKPPVLNLPSTILNTGEEFESSINEHFKLDLSTVPISLKQLKERLKNIDLVHYYPLVVEDDLHPIDLSESMKLPLVIREKDVEYQYHRIILFHRLLLGYPATRDRIIKEARIDIPPYFRGKVWAVLLGVDGDVQSEYDEFDKVSMTSTDRQIDVDIPRCHQYDYLLSSPSGHEKLKSVLKAWVVSHKNLVYWQGLDSLCAPFVSLNFNNEALAFKCLSTFIPRYLYNFFLKDNSHVIHEYLAVFRQLIAFHEPLLYTHMDEIGFQPELYAIPWFLTMFSHVFPLHKIFYLWDTLLLGNSMFPLCVGVAILQQFKEQLLSFGFNDCILLFSDMPGIDIERCVKDAVKVFNHTPPSAAVRKHDNPANKMKSPMEEQYMSLPEKEFLTLAQLRSEVCPRISPRDLVRITQLVLQTEQYPISSRDQNAVNLTKETRRKKTEKTKTNGFENLQKILVVDLRSSDEFAIGHLPHSVNVPFNQAVSEHFELLQTPAVQVIESHKGRMMMLLGNKGPEPVQFGQLLVSLGYRRICVMDGSISILKGLGYLSETL